MTSIRLLIDERMAKLVKYRSLEINQINIDKGKVFLSDGHKTMWCDVDNEKVMSMAHTALKEDLGVMAIVEERGGLSTSRKLVSLKLEETKEEEEDDEED